MPRSEERVLLEEVLGAGFVANLWTANCDLVLPVTLQEFQLGAILPAVIYMFRWGKRRGSGGFLKVYPAGDGRYATIASVTHRLSRSDFLEGFSGPLGNGLLGDLLLCYNLENTRHSPAHEEKLMRVYPTHYFSSWVDLPKTASHLRRVPEGLVALLVNQDSGRVLEPATRRTLFPLASVPSENLLLDLFSRGVRQIGQFRTNLALSDQFSEEVELGLDQLLAVRMAQQLGQAPSHASGSEGHGIPARLPISEHMNGLFREDFTTFIRFYGNSLPRLALLPMLEAALSLGLTTIFLSSVHLLIRWEEHGELLQKCDQVPMPLFADSSLGVDAELRATAEMVMNQVQLRIDRLAVALMSIRILDQKAARDIRLSRQEELRVAREAPLAREWLNLLGELAHDRHPRSEFIAQSIEDYCAALADQLKERYPDVAQSLKDFQKRPVLRLSEALCTLMGVKLLQTNYSKFFESILNVDGISPLAKSRRVRDSSRTTGPKTKVMRSLILSDHILDFLVHRHLLRNGEKMRGDGLSYSDFLRILHERYGIYVDKAPPGMEISAALLKKNRDVLERRLRDLGLLIGVNDAESMKRLKPRFSTEKSAATSPAEILTPATVEGARNG